MTESTEPRTAALTAPSETFLAVVAKTIGRHGHGIDLWNALHDAGLTITPAEPDRVVIALDDAKYYDIALDDRMRGLTDSHIRRSIHARQLRLRNAIAAAERAATGEA